MKTTLEIEAKKAEKINSWVLGRKSSEPVEVMVSTIAEMKSYYNNLINLHLSYKGEYLVQLKLTEEINRVKAWLKLFRTWSCY